MISTVILLKFGSVLTLIAAPVIIPECVIVPAMKGNLKLKFWQHLGELK